MKKVSYLLLGVCALFLALSSCKKVDSPPSSTATDTPSATIDYARIKKTSGKNGDMLIFESWEHFNEVKNALAEQCNTHATNFFSPLATQGQDYDQLTASAEAADFNQFKPLHVFADALSFSSLYNKSELQEKDWLLASNGESLDFTNDPFSRVERYESALFNEQRQVMIGESVFTLPGETFGKTDDCTNWDNSIGNSSSWNYHTSLGWRLRFIKGNTGVRPLENISSSTTYYRKSNGNWALWFTHIYSEINGTPYMNGGDNRCNGEILNWDAKSSSLGAGCYVYRQRYTGQNSWGIKHENKVQSVHKAPGAGYNGGSAYVKGF